MVTCTGHIGIHEGADGRTYVRTFMTKWRLWRARSSAIIHVATAK